MEEKDLKNKIYKWKVIAYVSIGFVAIETLIIILLIPAVTGFHKSSGGGEPLQTTETSLYAEYTQGEPAQTTQEEKLTTEEVLKIIKISYMNTSTPNSAGGVDLYIKWINKSSKTIKYIYFYAEAYNAVNDPVKCEIRRESVVNCSATGPYKSGEGSFNDSLNGTHWENVWYNNSITSAKLKQIKIEYMDGTSITLDEEESQYAISYAN